ncbi:DUF2239 family protein [Rothia nasimurium]|uniref:DUF2239 family protein n=1 Tax=Luteibacter anthropi TaxID=564369 RepID=A0A7X5U747_9GAMM|nr:DUF2239 family protein [Luteibacter anthropi]NII05039.1 DUF2239 family protein [Luteibacter anthropi]
MPAIYAAFDGYVCVAAGSLADVAERCKQLLDARPDASPIVYDDTTGRPVDIDYRGSVEDVLSRLSADETEPPAKRGPGRPKLGVVAREVTLLPRHWDWLANQPGGASVALRRLVESASREGAPAERVRQAREVVDRVMFALAGDLPGYEEASRAFHRHEADHFDELIAGWPEDVRRYVNHLVDRTRADA